MATSVHEVEILRKLHSALKSAHGSGSGRTLKDVAKIVQNNPDIANALGIKQPQLVRFKSVDEIEKALQIKVGSFKVQNADELFAARNFDSKTGKPFDIPDIVRGEKQSDYAASAQQNVKSVGNTVSNVTTSALDFAGYNDTTIAKLGGGQFLTDTMSSLGKLLPDIDTKKFGKIAEFMEKFGGNKFADFLTSQFGSFGNVASTMIKASTVAVKGYEDLRKQILKTTNANNDFFFSLFNMQSEYAKSVGISRKELFVEYDELSNQLAMRVDKDADKRLRNLALESQKLKKLGVTNTNDLYQTLNTQFNIMDDKMHVVSRRLIQYATETSQSNDKVFKDFKESMDKFVSIFDVDELQKNFSTFQNLSRKTGISIGSLADQVMKFDDLSQGFEAGSNLNVVLSQLGSNFDTMYMTQIEDPAQRMEYLYDRLSAARDGFEKLNGVAKRSMFNQLVQSTGMSQQDIKALLTSDKGKVSDIFARSRAGLGMEEISSANLDQKLSNIKTVDTADNIPAAIIQSGMGIQKAMMEADDKLMTKLINQMDQNFSSSTRQLSIDMMKHANEMSLTREPGYDKFIKKFEDIIERVEKTSLRSAPDRKDLYKDIQDGSGGVKSPSGSEKMVGAIDAVGQKFDKVVEAVKSPLQVYSPTLEGSMKELATAFNALAVAMNQERVCKFLQLHL
jgi:soluble cytochrome b562